MNGKKQKNLMKFSRFVYALERNGENYAKKSPPLNQKQDKILGGLFGLLIGDALGVPYEFYPPEQLPIPLLLSAICEISDDTWTDECADRKSTRLNSSH